MSTSFRLIVFDLDGTLVDSRRDLAESTNALILAYGGRPLDEALIGGMVGTGIRIWLEQALAMAGIAPFPADALTRFVAIYDQRLLHHTRAYEGMAEALQQAAATAELAVLTNKLGQATVKILEGLGLAQFFKQIVGVDGPYPPKPRPEGLQAIMAQAGVTPQETLLVGDSPIDLQTARHANTYICVARYGYGFIEVAPGELQGDELFIDRPAELAAVLFGRL